MASRQSSSWTRLSTHHRPICSRGGMAQSTAHTSGRTSKPCWMRAHVAGNAPPPCAKHTRKCGKLRGVKRGGGEMGSDARTAGAVAPHTCTRSFTHRAKTPPNMSEHMAREVSAGMPTSHGRKWRFMSPSPIMSQGCTNTAAPRSAAAQSTVRGQWASGCAAWRGHPAAHPQSRTRLKHGEQRRVVQRPRVDVRADLRSSSSSRVCTVRYVVRCRSLVAERPPRTLCAHLHACEPHRHASPQLHH